MIILKNISKKFGSKQVLNNINLKIKKGENIAIVGSNGSGKTTIVEIICGIQKPTEGIVETNGNIAEKIGVQFQEGVWPQKTRAIDLIKFFKGKNWRSDEYVKSIYEIFEIKDILKSEINKLSGGQKQRLNCFLAIINQPNLIVIDELITGLDLKMQIRLLNFFKKMKPEKEITLLIVSHIPDEIEQLCDRLIVLNEGKIYDDISLKKLLKKYDNVRSYIEDYFEKIEKSPENKNMSV